MLPKGSFQKPMNYNNNDNFIRINVCLVFSPKLNRDQKKKKNRSHLLGKIKSSDTDYSQLSILNILS